MLSSDPYPVSTQQQVAWLGNCWMILRYARGAGESYDQEAGKEKKELFEFTQNGLFTQPSLKMTFCCPDIWTCSGSWDDHLDSLLAGVGCSRLAVWSTVGTAAFSAQPASFVVTVAVFLELFDFCSPFFPGSQAICSEFLLETEPVFLCLIGGANR